jgi:ribonucleoside-diphosphate reductase alpha chain
MDYIFTSEEAKKLNKDIFETIYYANLPRVINYVKKKNINHTFFEGSPMSKGIFSI